MQIQKLTFHFTGRANRLVLMIFWAQIELLCSGSLVRAEIWILISRHAKSNYTFHTALLVNDRGDKSKTILNSFRVFFEE